MSIFKHISALKMIKIQNNFLRKCEKPKTQKPGQKSKNPKNLIDQTCRLFTLNVGLISARVG
jgi:hypothetical protein